MVNLIGLIMLLIAAIVLAVLKLFLALKTAALSAFVLLIGLDLFYRFRIEKGSLFKWSEGGTLILLPTWVFGICMVMITLIKL